MKVFPPYHGLLDAVLCLCLTFSTFKLFSTLFRDNYSEISYPYIVLAVLFITGTFLMLRFNKWGYWIMVGSRILLTIYCLWCLCEYKFLCEALSVLEYCYIFIPLAQVVVISLLMLLKKNGMNAYQVLWQKVPDENIVPSETTDKVD